MGGPKDETAPELISSDPTQESTNIKPEKLELEFNEYVKLETPGQSIIITPKLEKDKVEFLALKERVLITLNQELEENTTYVFNFQKSIQDITESNPAERLKLVFSTGPTIDSLSVSGKVDYLFTKDDEDYKDILIGLYEDQDSTNLFTAAPYYIAQADTSGNFEITNIKAGVFRAYAWYDENNSLKAEYRNEPYGFLSSPITVDNDIDNIHINLSRADLSPLKISRSTNTGSNFDIVLSKPLARYKISHEDLNTKLFYRLKENNLRFYHTEITNDSTAIHLQLMDSVGMKIDTTLYASFLESERRKENLEITSNGGTSFTQRIEALLEFNKPLITINYDSLFVAYDTASIIPITPEMLYLTDSTASRTKLIINVPINDSIPFEKYQLFAADSSFKDVENLWNEKELQANYTKLKTDNLGDEISGTVATEERPILVQLMDSNDNIVNEQYLTTTNKFSFTKLEATNYQLRAIIDRNGNKAWDPGNLNLNQQPEPVYFFKDEETDSKELILRGGWTLTDQLIEKRRETGLLINKIANDELKIEILPLDILIIDPKDLINN
jgi:hypothetical protein